jgi:5-carboxymethyl-2-hydroxymuconate isomerase
VRHGKFNVTQGKNRAASGAMGPWLVPLRPGDVIFTGTPTGAGARLDPPRWLERGDVVEVDVPGIGTLVNTVIDEPVSDESTMDQAVTDHPSHTTPQVRPW